MNAISAFLLGCFAVTPSLGGAITAPPQLPCCSLVLGDEQKALFNGTYTLQPVNAEPHKGFWWKEIKTGYEIYYIPQGVFGNRWAIQHPTEDNFAISPEIPKNVKPGVPPFGFYKNRGVFTVAWNSFVKGEPQIIDENIVDIDILCSGDCLSHEPSLSPTMSPVEDTAECKDIEDEEACGFRKDCMAKNELKKPKGVACRNLSCKKLGQVACIIRNTECKAVMKKGKKLKFKKCKSL